MNQAYYMYHKFHGKPPRRVSRRRFAVPAALVCLGDAKEIVYKCSKRNGGGDGRTALYVHRFGKGDKLYTDPQGKQLYILGGRMRVNSRGIVQ